jgi:hypothetical protein
MKGYVCTTWRDSTYLTTHLRRQRLIVWLFYVQCKKTPALSLLHGSTFAMSTSKMSRNWQCRLLSPSWPQGVYIVTTVGVPKVIAKYVRLGLSKMWCRLFNGVNLEGNILIVGYIMTYHYAGTPLCRIRREQWQKLMKDLTCCLASSMAVTLLAKLST